MQSRPRTSQIGAYARLAGGRAGIGAASAYIPRVVYDHGAHAEAEEAQCENEGVPPLPRSLFRPATSKSSAGCAASLHSPSCLRGTQFWDVEPDPHAGCAGGDEEQGRAIDASDPEVGRGNGSWDTYDAGDVAAVPRCASPGSAEPRATVLDPQVLAAAAHFCPRRAPAPPLPHTATTSPLRESRAQRAKSDAITAVASPRIERIERACRKALYGYRRGNTPMTEDGLCVTHNAPPSLRSRDALPPGYGNGPNVLKPNRRGPSKEDLKVLNGIEML
ncbi:hypothetical protein B0H15DRAFT_1006723 [Mycena belliarum]|uniref:Uncharacterized protein n=1 Tax=Mycena belliarum TaxID=1033014 RepID=A0AAD6TSC0_9AGAR|nr:hypothetical protein B0H15DRAFT_1006723 [Mycena belliae]